MKRRYRSSLRRTLLAALILPLAATALYLGDADLPPVRDLEATTLKWRYHLRGTVRPSDAVTLLMIDDRTLAALGRWPLSRRHLAEAVRVLSRDDARVIVFDLLFPEAEAGLSAEVAEILTAARSHLAPGTSALAQQIDQVLNSGDPDRDFAGAMEQAGSVLIPFSFVFEEGAGANTAPTVIREAAFRIYSRPAAAARPLPLQPIGVVTPAPRLAAAAAALAHVTVRLEPDGTLLHDQTVIGFGDMYFPSLPVEAVRLYDGVAKEDAALRLGQGIAFGSRFVPTDRTMRLMVNHYGPAGTFETHSLIDVMRGAVPAGTFADRIVLVGTSARGVGDTFPTPFARTLPGAEHHATVIDNILTGRALSGQHRTAPFDVIAILLGGSAAALLGAFLPLAAAAIGTAVIVCGWFVGAAVSFSTAHLSLAVAYPTIAAVLNFGAFSAVRLIRGRRSRRRIERQRSNLMRYFSPAVAERLMNSNRPGISDQTQHVAILFVDLVGSTAVSERLAPAEAMDLLRRFYRLVESAVYRHGGVLDKFMGDGALVVFGVPEPSPDDACNALRTARDIADGVNAWRREQRAASDPELSVGIGVHYGPVLVGDAGGDRQFSFTVVGDAVNTASRLESLTRQLDLTIIASDAVVEAARATGGQAAVAGFQPLPVQHLAGRERPVGIWGWPGRGDG